MYKIHWSLPARADLRTIFHYYSHELEDGSAQLAQDILKRIIFPTGQLSTLPFTGRLGVISGTRELLADKAPYLIIFRIGEQDQRVDISRVIHTSGLATIALASLGPLSSQDPQ